jgi:exo-beta-1,3-glucanase (GH17 family)
MKNVLNPLLRSGAILVPLAAVMLFLLSACGCGRFAEGSKIDLTRRKWCGNAICYSGYREGQSPQTGFYPSKSQILDDMRILAKHWRIIRTYGSDRHSEDVLEVIRREKIPIKVMLGAWLDGEPGHEAANAVQINDCIRLANAYRDVVVAVNVGNEVLASWSGHKVPEDKIIQYVKRVKDSVDVSVTVADDFTFWRDRGSGLAKVVDFVAMHTYPIWGKVDIDSAMAVTIRHYESVEKALPGKAIVITEAGWATYTVGDLHAPKAGDETKQKRYFEELTTWARKNNVNIFFFEAFDEHWKGSGTEGHWGLFSMDRKAKLAMREWYPELISTGPTSPAYNP